MFHNFTKWIEFSRCFTLVKDISSTDMALFATFHNYNLRWLVVPFSFDTFQRVFREKGRPTSGGRMSRLTKSLVRARSRSLMNPLYREKWSPRFNFLVADQHEKISSILFALRSIFDPLFSEAIDGRSEVAARYLKKSFHRSAFEINLARFTCITYYAQNVYNTLARLKAKILLFILSK